jgi:hypothetical protein
MKETRPPWLGGNRGGDQRSVGGNREVDRLVVARFHKCDGGEVSEVEAVPNPAFRSECFPFPKCSQPK